MPFAADLLYSLRRRSCHLPLFALLLAAACGSNAFAKDQVPDWVRAAAAQPAPAVSPRADAVFLLEETTYTVGTDGTLLMHVRKVVRVLRPQGRKYGEMFAGFRGGSKLHYMHLWSIGADGKEYAVKDSDLVEVGTGGGFELYSDSRARGGQAPAMDVGAVAAMEYELQERPFDNDLFWVPGESVPVAKERLTLNLPPGYTFKASWKGKPKADAVDAEGGRTLWEVDNQAALHDDERVPMAPSEMSVAPRMDIFYQGPAVGGSYGAMQGDWRSIGEWYERLAKDRNKPDPAMTAKAQELVQGKTGFRERVDAIASFVQGDIRYVAIEIGVGGYQPHAASDTFRARYGDCKDKATLLSAMLQAVGVRSTWVMVDTNRGVVNSGAPSLMGNHMIAAIELPADYKPERMYSVVTTNNGKRYLIFDPTWDKTPFGHLERELQGSDALLVDGADSQAIRLPVLKPEQNRVDRTAHFTLAKDGTLKGSVTEAEDGDIARNRRDVFLKDEKAQQDYLHRVLAHSLVAISVADVKTQNVSNLNREMLLTYSLQADHYASEMGNMLAIHPHVFGNEEFPIDAKRRRLPIDLGHTQQVHDDFTIALPAGYKVEELPAPVNLDLDFASYRSESKLEDNTIHYTRTYTVKDIELPADRYADVQKLARTIAGDEQSSAVLKPE